MITLKHTVYGTTTTCKDVAHAKRIIENLHKQGVDLMTIEVHWNGHVWLAYEF